MKDSQLVVIVDDDPLNNLVCKKFIELVRGYDEPAIVVDFTDPVRCIDYLRSMEHLPTPAHGARLFVDLNMPVMSGWEFLDAFAQLDPQFKSAFTVFIISSSVDPADHKRAAQYPDVAALIVKPLTRDLIRRLLHHDQRHQLA